MTLINLGFAIISSATLFFILASYAILFSAFLPLTGNVFLDALAKDTHYKYFALLIIPTGAYFVIANWVGWQYYRNS
ncbi:hypothetical protein GYMLUDRAFT_653870 [Collybiopsis luxurians FD-317 M1]|uniref:Uncharacterized protein n=1 Tax=Collybiopsis luxurians FD-317 M1 TaxID=944289 RepID=A0A0D0CM98_9AGAR|nr:hypothetical protein GYMLUDRAFT_653870 [Collybiopsis luxurians FD-317 M1]